MNAEIKVGPEKLGQAVLHWRGLEDSRRLRRQGRNTHFKVKSCKALIRSGRAGGSGRRGARLPSARHAGLPQARRPTGPGDRQFWHLLLGPEIRAVLRSQTARAGKWGAARRGSWTPGGLDAAEPAKAFFRYPGLLSLRLQLPIRLNGSLRLFPPRLLRCNGTFHCLPGPRAALQGTLALLPGKAPDVTALRDPEQPSPLPAVVPPCALSLSPFPSHPVDSRLGTSKQLEERGLQTQARWEFPLSVGPGLLLWGLCRAQSCAWPR